MKGRIFNGSVKRKNSSRRESAFGHCAKSGFFFKVPLKKIMDNLLNNNEQIYTWYFKVKTQSGSINIKDSLKDQIIYLTKNNVAEFFIPCGYFDQVDIQGLSFYYQDHHYIINYISDNGFLSVALDSEPERKIKIQIDKVKTKKNIFKIEGKIKSGPSFIKKGVVFLRGRETDAELTADCLHQLYEPFNHSCGRTFKRSL